MEQRIQRSCRLNAATPCMRDVSGDVAIRQSRPKIKVPGSVSKKCRRWGTPPQTMDTTVMPPKRLHAVYPHVLGKQKKEKNHLARMTSEPELAKGRGKFRQLHTTGSVSSEDPSSRNPQVLNLKLPHTFNKPRKSATIFRAKQRKTPMASG